MKIEKLRSIIENRLRNTSYVMLISAGINDLTTRIINDILIAKKIEEENKIELEVEK